MMAVDSSQGRVAVLGEATVSLADKQVPLLEIVSERLSEEFADREYDYLRYNRPRRRTAAMSPSGSFLDRCRGRPWSNVRVFLPKKSTVMVALKQVFIAIIFVL